MEPCALFDFDGVIADSEPLHRKTFLEILSPYGIDIPLDAWFKEYAGTGSRRIFERIVKEHSLDADPSEMVRSRSALFNRYVDEALVEPMAGVGGLLQSLSDDGWRMGIVSGGHRYYIEKLIDAYSIRRHFSAIVSAEDLAQRKPDPDPFLRGASLIGAHPDSCIVIEDSYSGILAGRRAMMKTIWVRPHEGMEPPDCDLLIESLEELSAKRMRALLSS